MIIKHSFHTSSEHNNDTSHFLPRTVHDISAEIVTSHHDRVDELNSVIRHPRSLARPVASWRPPRAELPEIGQLPALTAAISRYRVGPLAQARTKGYGEKRTPSYLIAVRITDPTGLEVSTPLAEAWIRALVPASLIDAVHHIDSGVATNKLFAWMVDGNYVPVHSPASLYENFSDAA